MKTVRFTQLIATSGHPEVHLAWVPPARDPVLKKAAKQHRVLTVHQHLRGAQKDFAVVGIEVTPDAQFLVFPKSLRPFAEQRVVGIQYDLLADALSVGPTPQGRRGKPVATKSPARSAKILPFPAHLPNSKGSETMIEPPPSKKPTPSVENRSLDVDPVKRELREILSDLAGGHTAKAMRRLRALL